MHRNVIQNGYLCLTTALNKPAGVTQNTTTRGKEHIHHIIITDVTKLSVDIQKDKKTKLRNEFS